MFAAGRRFSVPTQHSLQKNKSNFAIFVKRVCQYRLQATSCWQDV